MAIVQTIPELLDRGEKRLKPPHLEEEVSLVHGRWKFVEEIRGGLKRWACLHRGYLYATISCIYAYIYIPSDFLSGQSCNENMASWCQVFVSHYFVLWKELNPKIHHNNPFKPFNFSLTLFHAKMKTF